MTYTDLIEIAINDAYSTGSSYRSNIIPVTNPTVSPKLPKPTTCIDEWSTKSWGTFLADESKRKVKLFLKINKLMELILSNRSIDATNTEQLTFFVPTASVASEFNPVSKICYDCKILKQPLEVSHLAGYQQTYTKIKDILIRLCSDEEPTKEELIFLNEEFKKESTV